MKIKKAKTIRIVAASFLLAFSALLCTMLWARAGQQELSRELVRLHVIARSDSEEDQLLKLKVRDKILMQLSPLLDDAWDAAQAQEIITAELPELEAAAEREIAKAGFSYGAAAEIGNERYPTREYGGFALPAGEYVSLRITLGSGEGHNWWCVVFPPLCAAAVSDESEAIDTLSEDNAKLITAQDGEYILKFRIVEIIDELRN